MFKHPSYSAKCKALCSDPQLTSMRGIVIEALGYPNLMLMKGQRNLSEENPKYYIVRSIKAGK